MLLPDHNLPSENPRSPYQRAMRDGYRRLRFQRRLEAEFRHFHTETHLGHLRLSALLALSLYVLFSVFDFTSLPAYVANWTISLRLGLIVPSLVIALWASHEPRWRSHVHAIITVVCLITGLGSVATIGAALYLRSDMPYEGMLLVCLFIYFIVGLRWWRALLVNSVIGISLVLTESWLQPSLEIRTYHAIFMFAANVIGALGSYIMEYGTRTTFLVNGLLRELAERDGLTGLYNRRSLDTQLQRLWRQAMREDGWLAVAMIDVDHFKAYNDHYGHGGGDTVLRTLAELIAEQARRPLDVAARYGGEEFVLAWYMPARDMQLTLCERLREAVEAQAITHAASPLGVVTVTIGIALAEPLAGNSIHELLQQADTALYRGKERGRNCTVLYEASE
ncbi:diguanylate cyclase [Chitinimonas sp.]|uniref:GGDEF domain-containing protein n=1 Tax=Chitinimonas sp. TaxID=1934313 RepID=UPI0035B4DF9F